MYRDLHVIKEEDEYPNNLLNSVIKTIKCTGEGNVDKICKKLRNNSSMQYPKFQVEKVIDAAAQNGILEVKNNIYKLKDTSENKDYKSAKTQGRKNQSSRRIECVKESKSIMESELSENDYKSSRKSCGPKKHKCPHCGTLKKKSKRTSKKNDKGKKVRKKRAPTLKCKKKALGNKNKKRCKKMKKHHGEKYHLSNNAVEKYSIKGKNSNELLSLSSSYSDIDFLEAFEKESVKQEKNKLKRKCSKNSPSPQDNGNEKWSSFKSDLESESYESFQNLPKKKKVWSPVTNFKKTEISETDNSEVRKHSTSILVEDWLEHSNEPQGAIMQSNNLLQIEPIDLLVVKNPQPASYFM